MSANDRGRIRPPGNRLDRNPAAGAAAVSRHLPRRADAGQAFGSAGRAASGRPGRRSAITRSARRQAGHALCPNWPDHVYHWHREGFELPAGAELLAEGDDFPVQAFQYGHAFGFQFHPDVTYAMMHRWTTRGCERMDSPGARPRHLHFADRAVHDVTERAWLKQFIDGWLAGMPRSIMHVGSRGIAATRNLRRVCRTPFKVLGCDSVARQACGYGTGAREAT